MADDNLAYLADGGGGRIKHVFASRYMRQVMHATRFLDDRDLISGIKRLGLIGPRCR